MSTQLFTNNAQTAIAAQLINAGLTLVVDVGKGSLFSTPAANEYQLITLIRSDTDFEIVKMTNRSGDTLTIERAQEGTSAQQWEVGETVSARVTAGTMQEATNSEITAYGERIYSVSMLPAQTAYVVDWRNGNTQKITLNDTDIALSFSVAGLKASVMYPLTLVIDHDGTNASTIVTWPALMRGGGGWDGSVTTVISARDVFQIFTLDQGVTWIGTAVMWDVQA